MLEHDAHCAEQDKELTVLKEQFRTIGKDLDITVARVQLLVDQMHAQALFQATAQSDLTHIKGKVDEIEDTLRSEVASKSSVEGMRRWGTIVATAFILAFVGAFATFILRGGLK